MTPKWRFTAAATLLASIAMASMAAAQVHVTFGTSWDGASNSLQSIINNRYGAGHINVTTDYIGAHAGDPDPWCWFGDHFDALMVREVAGNANRNTLYWYPEENGTKPSIPGGGVVFDGPSGRGATAVIVFPYPKMHFGFMMDPNGPNNATNAPQPECFYTNRRYNDLGPTGTGALHEPYDGDVQALVFDVAPWTAPNTWLVCFEDLDSGAMPGPSGQAQTDNDFNDMVFEVSALGATPVAHMSFGELKAKYRH